MLFWNGHWISGVMLSTHPKWCKLIMAGKKTMEIRKTRPKLQTPFLCYIYQTFPKYGDWNDLDGHVIGEFTCDSITEISSRSIGKDILSASCLDLNSIEGYLGEKKGYAWHISDVKIYDQPKELSDFKIWKTNPIWNWADTLTRAPQSWCYIA